MKIGVDLDGVVVDFSAGWRAQYHQWFGGPLLCEDGTWNSIVTQTHFADEPAFWAWVDANPRFWADMAPIPGALGNLYELERAGHELLFVTNRKPVARFATERWLFDHGLGDSSLQMVKEKTEVDWDVLIEDNPRNLHQAKHAGRSVIRYVYPWNKGAPGIPAHGWHEVRPILDAMAEAFV